MPSGTTETPKGRGLSERLVMSTYTSPPASAVDAGDVGGGEGNATQSGTIRPNNDTQSGSGMSRKKSTATGTKSKRVSSPQTFNLDSLNSDLDIVPDVYFIPDPEFHRDMIIQPTSMLVPGESRQSRRSWPQLQLIINIPSQLCLGTSSPRQGI
jgi:hypothetical protein